MTEPLDIDQLIRGCQEVAEEFFLRRVAENFVLVFGIEGEKANALPLPAHFTRDVAASIGPKILAEVGADWYAIVSESWVAAFDPAVIARDGLPENVRDLPQKRSALTIYFEHRTEASRASMAYIDDATRTTEPWMTNGLGAQSNTFGGWLNTPKPAN